MSANPLSKKELVMLLHRAIVAIENPKDEEEDRVGLVQDLDMVAGLLEKQDVHQTVGGT
jgi:hypothetical protein